jgi:hypothetical protein
MNTTAIYALVAIAIFWLGFGIGHHQKTVSDNAAIVKQVVKVAKVDAKNEAQVEKQDDSDKLKITQLEQDLIVARGDASKRVPKPLVTKCVPQAEARTGAGQESTTTREPTGGGEGEDPEVRAYQVLRDETLTAGAVAEELRLQVLACQAQWTR